MALAVTASCQEVNVNSNTLLAIVMSGGIVPALCPKLESSSTTAAAASSKGNGQTTIFPSIATSTLEPPVPVAPPTNSAAVTTGIPMTTTKPATTLTTPTTIPAPQSQISESHMRSSSATRNEPHSTSTDAGGAGRVQTTTLLTDTNGRPRVSATGTDAAAATNKGSSSNDSGGGSPFDIQSAASQFGGNSALCALVVAVWASMVLGR